MKKLLSFILSVLLSALLALPCIAQSPKESVRASQETRQLRFEGATVHQAEFEYELKKYFSLDHTLYLMDRDGEMTADSCNYMSLLYKYDAEFFEENDLVMYIHPADKDDVHIDIENSMICIGDWIDTRFTVTEREEEYPCRNVITLIPVEKYSLLGFYPAPGGVHLDSAIEK